MDNARRRQIFFICDEDQTTEVHYAYRTVEEGFDMLRDELVIIRKGKRYLETLTACAEAVHRSVVPQFEGQLGHRKYLAVRLLPAAADGAEPEQQAENPNEP